MGAYSVDAVFLGRVCQDSGCQVSGRLLPGCSADWVEVDLHTLLVPHLRPVGDGLSCGDAGVLSRYEQDWWCKLQDQKH